jgi:hypothetical protein
LTCQWSVSIKASLTCRKVQHGSIVNRARLLCWRRSRIDRD